MRLVLQMVLQDHRGLKVIRDLWALMVRQDPKGLRVTWVLRGRQVLKEM